MPDCLKVSLKYFMYVISNYLPYFLKLIVTMNLKCTSPVFTIFLIAYFLLNGYKFDILQVGMVSQALEESSRDK